MENKEQLDVEPPFKTLDTVFVYIPSKEHHKACIVQLVGGKKPKFVKWIKPAKYYHTIPDFLREEFTKQNHKLLKPKHIDNLPKSVFDPPKPKKG